MTHTRNSNPYPGIPLIFQIRIKGHLGPHWSDWFEGLTITLEDNGDTLLTGPVADQAALYGVLRKVRCRTAPALGCGRATRPGRWVRGKSISETMKK